MPMYNVHVYREMRLRFDGIHAASAAEATDKVCGRPLKEADAVDDCDGETFSALVDLVDDEDYQHSQMIDYRPGRERKGAEQLLRALKGLVDGVGGLPITVMDGPFYDALRDAKKAVAAAEGRAGKPDAAAHPLLVAPGTPLQEGRMYLHLFHGRGHPGQEMDGWGFDGPVFGPLSAVQQAYFGDYRLYGVDERQELWLAPCQDMVVWEGRYYGDVAVFVAGPGKAA